MGGKFAFISKIFIVSITVGMLGLTIAYSDEAVENNRIEKNEGPALDLFDRGYEAYENEDFQTASDHWEKVFVDHKGTSVWGMATYNLGIITMGDGEYQGALKYFFGLLYSDANDLEPGQTVMEAYRNYHHKAALCISECYEMMGDMDDAHEYMIKARDEFRYQSWCGTCLQSHSEYIDEQLSRLFVLMDQRDHPEFCYRLEFEVNIESISPGMKQISLPIPTYNNDTHAELISNLVIDNMVIDVEDGIFEYVNFTHGRGLNLSFRNDIQIRCNIKIPRGSSLNTSAISDHLSTIGEYYYYYDRGVDIHLEDQTDDGVRISFKFFMMDHPPDWNHIDIDIEDVLVDEDGWTRL